MAPESEHTPSARYIASVYSSVKSKNKIFPEPRGPLGGADIRFSSPQPDTSLHCETTDEGLVHRLDNKCPLPFPLGLARLGLG